MIYFWYALMWCFKYVKRWADRLEHHDGSMV